MKQSAQLLALSCVLYGAWPCLPRMAADDVHLDNGEVIEGKATRSGDKVVIEMESGQISLSASSVKRIDERESSVEHFEKKYSQLAPNDVAQRLQLANYCRDHGMRERERLLLQQVIERDPNHEQARKRLGYVKSSAGWITYEEHMRALGQVQREGRWMSREQATEQDRQAQQARVSVASQSDEAKKIALERQKLELERQRLELERSRDEAVRPVPSYGYYGYGYAPRSGYPRTPVDHTRGGRGYDNAARTWPINGTRDPRDDTWALPGTRNPRESLP